MIKLGKIIESNNGIQTDGVHNTVFFFFSSYVHSKSTFKHFIKLFDTK